MIRSLLLLSALLAPGCCPAGMHHAPAASPAKAAPSPERAPVRAKADDNAKVLDVLEGKVSYYHDSLSGNHTANGEVYDPKKLTAAHRKLPFGTRVRITRLDNGRSVTVRVNDRGPFGRRKRIFDLSRAAAEKLDMIHAGVVEVRAEVLGR